MPAADLLILESIVTTRDVDRLVNVAPMGALVDREMTSILLRPFHSSRTYANLKRTGQAVLHVTDDVELIACAAVNALQSLPAMREAEAVDGAILNDACRWYALKVVESVDEPPRAEFRCEVVDSGRQRDFFGLNRAQHAVVEAAILATRLHLIPADKVDNEMQRLAVLIEKTAGLRERRAFTMIEEHIARQRSRRLL